VGAACRRRRFGERLRLVAADLVDHFEKRLEAMDGKAMVVCMSRRICVELYREIVALRPEWAGEGDDAGAIKVVMTGNATDPLDSSLTSGTSRGARRWLAASATRRICSASSSSGTCG